MKKLIEDYFTLPRWERWGIVILVILNVGFIIWFNMAPDNNLSPDERARLEKNFTSIQTNKKSKVRQSAIKHPSSAVQSQNSNLESQIPSFNPNRVNKEFLIQAGVSPRLAARWEKYIAKGGKFNTQSDVLKLYGMDSSTYKKLYAYMTFETDSSANTAKKKYEPEIIDINTADTAQLNALPGIGASTAKNIVSYRNALGGFYSLEQLKELKSIRPENYDKMIAYLKINHSHSAININTISEIELSKHPYFRKGIAGATVAYRQKHGNYTSENDLLKCVLITPEVLERIKPYIVFE